MMKVTCVETPNSSKSAYAVYYDNWPASTLKHRGWDGPVVYRRDATDKEKIEAKESMRYLGFRYQSWDEVVEDEAKYGIDAHIEREKYES